MKIKKLFIGNVWSEIKDIALTTIGKSNIENKEPDSNWKKRMLLAEHSPIRYLTIKWLWEDIPYFVSVHFTRHKIGIEHFVKTQRTDRTNINRNDLSQSNYVNHMCVANAQAFINISKKRLCNQASTETRDAWNAVLTSFKDIEPELYNVCVPDCIYRGHCYEFKSCGYYKTDDFKRKLEKYRKGVNDNT